MREHSHLSVVFLSAVQPQHGVELALRPETLSSAASPLAAALQASLPRQAALLLSRRFLVCPSFCGRLHLRLHGDDSDSEDEWTVEDQQRMEKTMALPLFCVATSYHIMRAKSNLGKGPQVAPSRRRGESKRLPGVEGPPEALTRSFFDGGTPIRSSLVICVSRRSSFGG